MARANLKTLLEDAEMRVQRGQSRLNRQRVAVAALERADRDATLAKRALKILEKAPSQSMSPIGTGLRNGGRDRLINPPKQHS